MEQKLNYQDERLNRYALAIKKLDEAESAVLDALQTTYGEEHGEELMRKLPFDTIDDEVLRYMRVILLENMYCPTNQDSISTRV